MTTRKNFDIANVARIRDEAMRIIRNLCDDASLLHDATITRYEYDENFDQIYIDMSIKLNDRLYFNDNETLYRLMRTLCVHDDIIDEVSFKIDDVEFVIGDGDDCLACFIENNRLIVWIRSLQSLNNDDDE